MTRSSRDIEGARLSNWLADYSHDLMEEGDFDQEAAELDRAAQWIADRLASQPSPSSAGGGNDVVAVPKNALDWLFGEAPAPDGRWFGDDEDIEIKTMREFSRKYWWRTRFRKLMESSSKVESSAHNAPVAGSSPASPTTTFDPAQASAGSEDKEGARLSNWLADYSHDLMEEGDFDQEAAELNRAAQWIADRLNAPAQASAGSASCHPIETMWRECGLPEWFLGNGGSNTKLYTLYDRIRHDAQPSAGTASAKFDETGMSKHLREIIGQETIPPLWIYVTKEQIPILEAIADRLDWLESLYAPFITEHPPQPTVHDLAQAEWKPPVDNPLKRYTVDQLQYEIAMRAAVSSTQSGTVSTTAGEVQIKEAALTIAIPSPHSEAGK